MLRYIKGELTMKLDSGIVVEAGGLGYEISVPGNSRIYLTSEGQEVTVFTSMIVREDDISLYGFNNKEELETFHKLITVSGVGAKAALSILSAMPLSELQQAIIFEDAKTLTRANGVGKKTAERIVLELKDKFGQIENVSLQEGMDSVLVGSGPVDGRTEAIEALINLGYSKGEAVNAVASITEKDMPAEHYLKQALKKLF